MTNSLAGERGGFVMGLVVGLLVGLALALGVALYITKAPVPFINKVPQRTAEQDSAETERNRNWDPNGALGAKPLPRVASPSASSAAAGAAPLPQAAAPVAAASTAAVTAAVPPPAKPAPRDPAAGLATGSGAATPATLRPGASAPDPFFYFVQAGAYTRSEEAEQQRARLALMGQTARITEREQVGRTVYRVRVGPLPTREEAAALQGQLQDQSVDSQIVRVERP